MDDWSDDEFIEEKKFKRSRSSEEDDDDDEGVDEDSQVSRPFVCMGRTDE